MPAAVEKQLLELAEQVVTDMGYELYHLDYRGAGLRSVVRVYIDRDGGVRLDDCAAVSRRLGAALDAVDIVSTAYVLEVSSPGLDRPLFRERDYQRFTGRRASVKTFQPVEGRRQFSGRIQSCAEGLLHLVLEDGREFTLPLSDLASGRLEVDL